MVLKEMWDSLAPRETKAIMALWVCLEIPDHLGCQVQKVVMAFLGKPEEPERLACLVYPARKESLVWC